MGAGASDRHSTHLGLGVDSAQSARVQVRTDDAYACGLRSAIREHPGSMTGILNGLDLRAWDPASDPHLEPAMRFDAARIGAGKACAKAWLQAHAGLPAAPRAPLFAFIGRLADQKGVDVLLKALLAAADPGTLAAQHAAAVTARSPVRTCEPVALEAYGSHVPTPSCPSASVLPSCIGNVAATAHPPRAGRCLQTPPRRRVAAPPPWQAVLLGTGDAALEAELRFVARGPLAGRVVGIADFDECIAHRLMAAADVVVVPSRFEPCGLVALSAMRYGAVPLVASTGGAPGHCYHF